MNTLLYAMGGESEDIFTSFIFDDGVDQNNYNRVKQKFDHHYIAKKNVIHERAKFNQRVQAQDEPVEISLQIFIVWPNSVNMDL